MHSAQAHCNVTSSALRRQKITVVEKGNYVVRDGRGLDARDDLNGGDFHIRDFLRSSLATQILPCQHPPAKQNHCGLIRKESFADRFPLNRRIMSLGGSPAINLDCRPNRLLCSVLDSARRHERRVPDGRSNI